MTLIKKSDAELTGMVGAVVISQRYGKKYLRTAPVRTKDSWSPAQLLHRQRFSRANSFCKQFKNSLIPQIWKPEAQNMSGYGLMLKTNMPAFGPDGSVTDPKLIQLSIGQLFLPKNLQASREAEGSNTVRVSWQKSSPWGGLSLKDELMVISEADGQYSELKATGLVRGLLGGSFELPSVPQAPSPMHIYLFFASNDRRDYSESVCIEV